MHEGSSFQTFAHNFSSFISFFYCSNSSYFAFFFKLYFRLFCIIFKCYFHSVFVITIPSHIRTFHINNNMHLLVTQENLLDINYPLHVLTMYPDFFLFKINKDQPTMLKIAYSATIIRRWI